MTTLRPAIAVGKDFVQRNRVGAFTTVPEDAIDIEAGTWNSNTRSFTPGGSEVDAIQVSGDLSDQPLFFGVILGNSAFSVPRKAIALADGPWIDVIMTLDLSGSMASQGRIQALRDAAPTFVNVIEEIGGDDRIGVFGYGAVISKYNPASQGHSGSKYLATPSALYPAYDEWCAVQESGLTSDFGFLRNSVLDHGTLLANKYNGWTPIGAAIRDSAHYLNANARPKAEKIIVLMSDGQANKPSGNGPGYALDMANYAKGLDIKVYTISLGYGADEDLMQQIADTTGGEHFIASGDSGSLSADLTRAFEEIAKAIKQTQLVQ